MHRTSEEHALREVDALYRGALFLVGGDRVEAETLLLAVVRRLARAGDWAPDAQDRTLVHELFNRGAMVSSARAFARSLGENAPTAPCSLFTAAGQIPPRPRAALWLVLVRRHSYARAASLMGMEAGEFRDLLTYRLSFMNGALETTTAPQAVEALG